MAVALFLCVVLSLACGLAAAAVHLFLGVASGWAYNLYFKRTVWSAVPYAVAFGTLPAVVTLALPDPELPPLWTFFAGALLGVGAHLLNVLPDLADDASTGVHGLPNRLGERRVRVLAPLVLLAASCVVVLGPGTPDSPGPWVALGACVVLAVVSVTSRGRAPFLAAIGIALVDVVSLVVPRLTWRPVSVGAARAPRERCRRRDRRVLRRASPQSAPSLRPTSEPAPASSIATTASEIRTSISLTNSEVNASVPPRRFSGCTPTTASGDSGP